MTPQDFINTFNLPTIEACQGTGLLPSVKLAQSALETGWGASVIGEANNMYGIKASGPYTPYWKGAFINKPTREYVNGEYITVVQPFRKYNSLADSIKDHTYFLQQFSRYNNVFSSKTPEEQTQALQDAGYATDPDYASKLMSIINAHNLTELDKKKII